MVIWVINIRKKAWMSCYPLLFSIVPEALASEDMSAKFYSITLRYRHL